MGAPSPCAAKAANFPSIALAATPLPSHEWLAADADGREVTDPKLGQGIACDPTACIGKLSDGRLVSYVLAPEAIEEDCRRAAVVVSIHAAPPPDCGAFVIGRELWRTRGALSLRRDGGEGFVTAWAQPRKVRSALGAAAEPFAKRSECEKKTNSDAERAAPRDATPKPEDLQADD